MTVGDYTKRIGKVMPFVSADGAPEHTESFWCLDILNVDIYNAVMELRFVGYNSIEAYDADRQPLVGAVKEYRLTGASFDEAISRLTIPAPLPIAYQNVQMAWAVAFDTRDIEGDPPVSFFNGAVDPPPRA